MKPKNNLHIWAIFLLIAVALFWGGGYTATQIAIDNGWSTYSILLFKNSIAAIIATVFAIKTRFWKDKKLLLSGLITGVLFFAGYAFQITGQIYTSISNAAFITTSGLVFVPIIAWLVYHKKPHWTVFIAFALEITAAVLLSFATEVAFHIGDLLVMIGAVVYSIHILYVSNKCKDHNPLALAAVQFFVMAACSGIGIIVDNKPVIGEINGFYGILYLAIFSGVICLAGQVWAQKHLSSNETSIIISQEGLFASIIAVVLYGEVITTNLVIGATLMTAALLILQINPKKNE